MPLVRSLLFLFSASCAWAAMPDLLVFDEDDPLGIQYYDASIGRFREPSTLRLLATSADKMPITTNAASSGRCSGVIEYRSRPEGAWALNIFRLGFGALNLTGYQAIHFAVNGPEAIPAVALPAVELHDVRGKVASRPLRDLPGIDADPATWQKASIALSSFETPAGFDFAAVKHVTFGQGGPDGGMRILWIDELHFRAADRLVSSAPPAAPGNLAGRAGDRSITLHWEAVTDPLLRGYHVYRGLNENGPFTELAGPPVSIQSIADVRVENGRAYFYQVKAANDHSLGPASSPLRLTPRAFAGENDFLEYVQATAFDYFWYEANPANGLVRDRTQPWSAASIAAMGFGLTAIGIGIDHGWVTREAGRERVVRTLRTLWNTPQGEGPSGTSGYKGWFYHFLQMKDGSRFGTSELSSIDTALLLGGILYAREYFDADHAHEREIRQLAERIFGRVDWRWMLADGDTLSMGWHPEHGFLHARWKGYNEASLLYVMGLGAADNPLEPEHWRHWTRSYSWKTSYGYSFIHFPPLFGHQYSACWIDFRNIADDYTASKGITYFENSRRATLAQRAYCIANPDRFAGYSADLWGLTACDGPGSGKTHSYIARGAPPPENDDGTIAPTAAGGSIPFAPIECLKALRSMYDLYRERIWCGYGFRDAFNLGEDWWGRDVIGIDQGPILIMAENYRTGRVWKIMEKSEILNRGLKRAGFQPFPAGTPPRQ